ncbi:monofunctional biosynthetic peptidoglycan transglycosylase [Nicoletella semolina]|uniref:Biosynthetic peptidoglycan transglycosylase n=1 Tax=Nicoletella semolina TaxID=271160 RepID=A0A4R2N889_9PAST|nr:monofunctional biosynthetic peptidoglycan transglycosylase [Nicoletella semolina]MDH2923867.1 monofunctional biosynthetic peptidoglycan transglycosylase [Nicoletella semolina]TCP17180.1 monofunctional biosynthetic peptidoglycan transglycosylase [Nicoletella semolina]
MIGRAFHRLLRKIAVTIGKILAVLAGFYIILTLLFMVVPVPFSSYMAQRKIESWLQRKDYSIEYDWVNLKQISWQMQMAVIAAEDQKFEQHFGFDFQSIEKALQRNEKSKRKPRGASTISQQTVKNLYLWHEASWTRKVIEVPLTLLVENIWDKSRILEVYLNIAEFGYGIFGVEAAAQYYFHKSANLLTLQEASLLAASLPNPHIFKVKSPNAAMRTRQHWIMRQVQNLGGAAYLDKL